MTNLKNRNVAEETQQFRASDFKNNPKIILTF